MCNCKKSEKKVPLGVSLEPATWRAIEEIATTSQASRSQIVQELLTIALPVRLASQ